MTDQAPRLRTTDVAKRLGVSEKTVARWAKEGKVRAFLTPGGHRRFFEEDIQDLLREEHANG